ncbi:gluconokinase [Cutibacterium acnes JCM 18918]|nr:gluconokinase [Cutibacterium acnes JCM 18918]
MIPTHTLGQVNEDHDFWETTMSVNHLHRRMPLIVIMGVAGAGKTDIDSMLAERFGVDFMDGDDLHPQANIDKMTSGYPLNDEDRRPWLTNIAAWMAERADNGAVVACSALKHIYRDQLRKTCQIWSSSISLATARSLPNGSRLAPATSCQPASLTPIYATLEPLAADEAGITLNFDDTREELTTMAATWLADVN